MSEEFIHTHPNPLGKTYHLFLLFIPLIIFSLILAFLFTKYEKAQIAQIKEETSVLGGETTEP